MRHSVLYTLGFSALLCIVCAVMVSGAAVSLKPLQDSNKVLDRKLKVLEAAGVIETGTSLTAEEVAKEFESIELVFVDLATGQESRDGDPETYDARKAQKDPDRSRIAPANNANIARVPNRTVAYKMKDAEGRLATLVLPIEGYGLWGTLYGYLALEGDLNTVRGITYYEHKETPGLGGEVDNPLWKALWPGRRVYDESGEPAIEVIKGYAGSVAEDPHKIDGLSGATITSRGITNMLDFWLGSEAYGPYLDSLRQNGAERSAA